MTIEERVDWLCRLRTDLNNGVIFTPWNKKFTEALTGILEQEPCPDAVSRQAAIDALYELCGEGSLKDNPWRDNPHIDAIIDAIDDLPPVNPQEPKTGHWIEHPEIETSTPEYLMFYECSECGNKQCFCKSDIHKKHFCNNCGLKMFEPQEG